MAHGTKKGARERLEFQGQELCLLLSAISPPRHHLLKNWTLGNALENLNPFEYRWLFV